MIEHFNEKVTTVAKAFNVAKTAEFLAGRPTVKNDIFGNPPADATLTADLETFMNADSTIPYDSLGLNNADKDFALNIIKSKIYNAL